MRTRFRAASARYEIFTPRESRPDDTPLRFRETSHALEFLRPLATDSRTVALLRHFLDAHFFSPALARASDRQVLELAARHLYTDRLRIVRLPPLPLPLGRPDTDDEQAPRVEAAAEKTWIAIQLVDEQGEPVEGIRYEITVPGKDQPLRGTLDEQGIAHLEGLDPGNCIITFPELDQDAWQPVQ